MKTRFLSDLFKRTLFLSFVIISHSIHANAVWNSGSTSDVTDMDLFLDGSGGDIVLPAGPRSVSALTTSITVTLGSDPVVVGNDTAPGSQLLLCARDGNEIRFVLGDAADQDLTFRGGTTRPLVMTIDTDSSSGAQVVFQIAGDRTVAFTSDGAGAGAHAYVVMNAPDTGNNIPKLRFERASASDTRHVEVVIGNRAKVTYLNPTAVDLPHTDGGSNGLATNASNRDGLIEFEPSNDMSGRMVLRIEDGGAFIIEGLEVGSVVAKDNLNDLSITNSAVGPIGRLAIARVINENAPTANAGLLVLNENNELGYNGLQSDPFCLDSFDVFARRGFILGALGELDIDNDAFFDYVGLTGTGGNVCPDVMMIPGFGTMNPEMLLKTRNASAFFVDGIGAAGPRAKITLGLRSGMYFRSGVDVNGTVRDLADPFPFTIDPANRTPEMGNIVFDVEGPLDVCGSNAGSDLLSKIEILSLYVAHTGGPLFADGAETIFPIRTFATDGDDLRQYNAASFLINNDVNLQDVALEHTDEIHNVYQKNDVSSEPTYVGGERFWLKNTARPYINFLTSYFLVRADAAITGVDLCVPNETTFGACVDNNSGFTFFSNGHRVDDGTGRTLILGTQVGATACDGCTIISRDAHLDVKQTSTCGVDACDVDHLLLLDSTTNSTQVNNNIVDDITGQTSVHTIYLGHASNISVGLQNNPFDNQTKPNVCISGNYFSFETRGGSNGLPETSNVTGEGGIFVDRNGTFKIDPDYRANISAMITKSDNGIVDLPKEQVFFDKRIGIANWQPDLSVTQTLILSGECVSDYTLNWIGTTKDYDNWTPYELGSINVCECPEVTLANITNIPTFEGTVDQLQIQGSRIGDQAHIRVNCGRIRELVFPCGGYSAQAPAAVVVLENDGRVGIGTAQRNVDSLEASVVLGVNGVSVIANGDGEIDLNEDVLVNNICSFLKGPDFEGNVLQINADVPREIRVKKSGILDFRSFADGDIIQFTGEVRVILEAGARIITDGATISFVDNTCLIAEPFVKSLSIFEAIPHGAHDELLDPIATVTDASVPHNRFAPHDNFGAGLANTDDFRVRLIGTGNLEFDDCACFLIPEYAFVGVESLMELKGTETCEIATTDLSILLNGTSQFIIGDVKGLPGGSFQVGNTVDRTGHMVNLTLSLLSDDARACINPQGFMGLGVGIVDKRSITPNEWLVANLFNTTGIILNVTDGLFKHDRIFDGEDPNASLLAIGKTDDTTPGYTLIIEDDPTVASSRTNNAGIHGGGNMVVVDAAGNVGALHPVVLDDDGDVLVDDIGTVNPRLDAGILSSRPLLEDDDQVAVGADVFFAFAKVKDHLTDVGRNAGRGVAAEQKEFNATRSALRVGWVNTAKIGRVSIYDVANALGGTQKDRRAQASGKGAVGIQIDDVPPVDPPGDLVFAQQLP